MPQARCDRAFAFPLHGVPQRYGASRELLLPAQAQPWHVWPLRAAADPRSWYGALQGMCGDHSQSGETQMKATDIAADWVDFWNGAARHRESAGQRVAALGFRNEAVLAGPLDAETSSLIFHPRELRFTPIERNSPCLKKNSPAQSY